MGNASFTSNTIPTPALPLKGRGKSGLACSPTLCSLLIPSVRRSLGEAERSEALPFKGRVWVGMVLRRRCGPSAVPVPAPVPCCRSPLAGERICDGTGGLTGSPFARKRAPTGTAGSSGQRK
jgi:hypothetical protein